jgi:TfoX N-terminal domain
VAFDTKLADRIRERLGQRKGLTERKMFGGIGFMLGGNMACGVHGQDMIVRVDPSETERLLGERHTRQFDLTGRPMKGWILVEPGGVAQDATLGKWVGVGATYAESLPPK